MGFLCCPKDFCTVSTFPPQLFRLVFSSILRYVRRAGGSRGRVVVPLWQQPS